MGSTQATTSIYTDVYIHIYTLFSTLFWTHSTLNDRLNSIHRTNHRTRHTRSSIATKKKFFHRFPHEFTRFHKISPSKNTKKHQNPQNREKPEKTVFLGVPPHPPKNPYFPGFSGPPKLHKFAQICTNLHQFAPPKHHFWGVPNLPGPSG